MLSIKTLLVEDEISRLGLKKMLESLSNIMIVAEANCGQVAIQKALELCPDLVLTAIGLPDIDGIEVTRRIKESIPAKIVIVTYHESKEMVLAALAAGAEAFCTKGVSIQLLSSAIRAVMDGGVWLESEIARKVFCSEHSETLGTTVKTDGLITIDYALSERELGVLKLLTEGLSNQEMAFRLGLSSETIKTHMRHIMEKLKVSDRTQAAVKAIREKIVIV